MENVSTFTNAVCHILLGVAGLAALILALMVLSAPWEHRGKKLWETQKWLAPYWLYPYIVTAMIILTMVGGFLYATGWMILQLLP